MEVELHFNQNPNIDTIQGRFPIDSGMEPLRRLSVSHLKERNENFFLDWTIKTHQGRGKRVKIEILQIRQFGNISDRLRNWSADLIRWPPPKGENREVSRCSNNYFEMKSYKKFRFRISPTDEGMVPLSEFWLNVLQRERQSNHFTILLFVQFLQIDKMRDGLRKSSTEWVEIKIS
jgi:hypothetical protein